MTRAGYAIEYECKITAADFRADAKKGHSKPIFEGVKYVGQDRTTKHDKLVAGDPKGPSRFYYVVPKVLSVLESECPAWAGFAVARSDDFRWGIRVLKQAPQLHKVKINKREIRLAQNRMWFRYWAAIENMYGMGLEEHLHDSTMNPDEKRDGF